MRFIHLADLHIGKRFKDVNLLEDQVFALKQVTACAADPSIDAVIIAGDVYDKPSPSSEAMTVFNDFVTGLVRLGKKIFIISGNHDSDQRISYYSGLIRNSGVYVSEAFGGTLQTITYEDEYGTLYVHLLPFLKPVHVKRFYPDEEITTYEDAMRAVIAHSTLDTSKRNLLLCHQFITGAELCDSEELAVGGLDNISASVFRDFDYVALGHIHKPQSIGRPELRYSGSLIKYSFSEAKHKKSFCVVDMKEKGNIDIRLVPIALAHDVRDIDGMLDDVLAMEPSDDYVRITLHDEQLSPDSRRRLLSLFPNMMTYQVVNSKTSFNVDLMPSENIEDKTVRELFCDFYNQQNNQYPSEELLKLFDRVLKEVGGERE